VDVRSSPDPVEWADAIRAERHAVEAAGPWVIAPALETLYVGGGTPSLLGPEAMRLLAEAVGVHRLDDPGLEWTAEANPESLSEPVARGWRDAGVSRISLGVQSFDGQALRWMGRLHGAKGARDAVGRVRSAGIENLSIDLIFGLPEEIPRDWPTDLEAAVALDVPHISLYGLTAEPGTPLHRRVVEGAIDMTGEERYRDEYLAAHERLVAAGYLHYEVSNFARPGFESRHNQAYWAGVPYFGFGNSAHSYLPPVRRGNLRDWGAYLARIRSGELAWDEEDLPDASGRRVEELWLGLRTDRGLSRELLVTDEARRRVREWERRGWAQPEPSRVRLTAEGWLVLDSLVLELDRILEGGRDGC
jgi:oxygen-independent coproporphyrinogen-3 oxidase